MIRVAYQKKGKDWNIRITLPKGLRGKFIWKGRENELTPGENELK